MIQIDRLRKLVGSRGIIRGSNLFENLFVNSLPGTVPTYKDAENFENNNFCNYSEVRLSGFVI